MTTAPSELELASVRHRLDQAREAIDALQWLEQRTPRTPPDLYAMNTWAALHALEASMRGMLAIVGDLRTK